jgi:hypothetical protein
MPIETFVLLLVVATGSKSLQICWKKLLNVVNLQLLLTVLTFFVRFLCLYSSVFLTVYSVVAISIIIWIILLSLSFNDLEINLMQPIWTHGVLLTNVYQITQIGPTFSLSLEYPGN